MYGTNPQFFVYSVLSHALLDVRAFYCYYLKFFYTLPWITNDVKLPDTI